jgi:hypothetical protein
MVKRKRNERTVETHTLTLIHKDGRQAPVGELGFPTFQPFHNWLLACEALAKIVLQVGGIAEIHGVVVTTTQATRGGELLLVDIRKYTPDEVTVLCFGTTLQQLRQGLWPADQRYPPSGSRNSQ